MSAELNPKKIAKLRKSAYHGVYGLLHGWMTVFEVLNFVLQKIIRIATWLYARASKKLYLHISIGQITERHQFRMLFRQFRPFRLRLLLFIIPTLAERDMSVERVSPLLRRTINPTIIVDLYTRSRVHSLLKSFGVCIQKYHFFFFFVLTSTHTLSVFIVKFVCAHNRFIMCCVAFNVKVIHMLNKFVANCLCCTRIECMLRDRLSEWNMEVYKNNLKVYKQLGTHIHGFDRTNQSNRTHAERHSVPTLTLCACFKKK